MTLQRLSIQHFRNLKSVDISLSPGTNLFYGENGSGKTSVLEAVNVLALGRSFRSHKHKALVEYGAAAFTVFGKARGAGEAEIAMGIQRRTNGEVNLRVNGAAVNSVAELALQLPVQVINSDTFQLLEGSPKIRRQFMDWLVFHVEHQFYLLWKALQRCLKHRNSLLRHDRMDAVQLAVWDQELVSLTEQIHILRVRELSTFIPVLEQLLTQLPSLEKLSVSYLQGWDKEKNYSDVLRETLERDKRVGVTHYGSHRADLKITIQGHDAAEALSRGQQKLLVCALKVAQAKVFSQLTGRRCIFLVDDLPAELDHQHRQLLVDWLQQMNTQLFITGVDPQELRSSLSEDYKTLKMFHVEHGEITEQY